LKVNPLTNIAEGIVIWPIYPFQDRFGDWVIAKTKSPAFAETRSEQSTTTYVVPTSAAAFAEEFGTETRFEHVTQSLRDQGIDKAHLRETRTPVAHRRQPP
jgi:hypothetical protein